MMKLLIVLLVASAVYAEQEMMPIHHWLNKTIQINMEKFFAAGREVRGDLSWSLCGGDGSVKINKLKVPSVIALPTQGFAIEADIETTRDFDNFAVELKVEKKMGFWITIPCVSNLGSCKYADICGLVKTAPDTTIAELNKYGLQVCPFKQMHVAQNIVIDLPAGPSVGGIMINGKYRVQIKLNAFPESLKQTHLCLKAELELKV